jgi:hypothetical protein
MRLELRPSVFILWVAMTLALAGEVVYQGTTIETQAHTIQEQLGQAVGPDATPQPLQPPPLPELTVPEQPLGIMDNRRVQNSI